MSYKKCYTLEYQCTMAIPGRHIVVANNGHDALKLFMGDWTTKFNAGEVDIPPWELQNIEMTEWCGQADIIGKF